VEELAAVTPDMACAHPNWVMGRKISVDSATMMNKGLEVIEAHWLFGLPAASIQVVIHPQSVIHSMVSYADGSVIAQLGNPDMRTPIAHAMAYPQRVDAGVRPLDLFEIARLDFERPDLERFPAWPWPTGRWKKGGLHPPC
jgi:1-deoxy-D-xylulose-5-phosphate reductoisomerase